MPGKRGRPRKQSVRSSYGYSSKKRYKVVKKQHIKTTNPEISASGLRQMIQNVRWTDSYTSLLMGVVVVVVAVLFVVSFLKTTHHIQQTSSTSTVAPSQSTSMGNSGHNISPTSTPSELKPANEQKTYTVKAGDDLWHIAEKFYKSGYNWVDIAQANNLANPSDIYPGNTLIIPSVTPKVATITVTPTPTAVAQNNTITTSTYTVQKGDDLWHIAVRAYGDGYQWVKIAQANNLSNPSLIFSGNILKIPR